MSDKKITLSTVKAFIRKNEGKLLIDVKSKFDGMCDGVRSCGDRGFSPVQKSDGFKNTLGIQGAWFVFQSRDYFSAFEKDGLKGIEVYNCCGSFVIAVDERSAS